MMTPRFWYGPKARAPIILRPWAMLYGCLRKMHVSITHPVLSPVPTICVGNVTVGGAGKTPVARALRALLHEQAPVILTRGYRGALSDPVLLNDHHTFHDVGDEALLHALDGPVIVARNRLSGAKLAATQNTKLIIMDDGLQNRTLTAQMNILVIDGAVGFGNSALIPAGPLREPIQTVLARTHAVIIIGDNPYQTHASIPHPIPVFTARAQYDLSKLDPNAFYLAFAGLARPQKFYDALHSCGLKLISHADFPDHYAYTAQDIEELTRQACAQNANLITTEKDIVKIPPSLRASIAVLPMTLVFDRPDDLRATIQKHLTTSSHHDFKTPH